MAEIRETHVERDEHGRVTDTKVRVEQVRERRRGGGFGVGLMLGAILIAAAIGLFAYTQGSFQSAGREADQVTAQAEQQIDGAIENTQALPDQPADETGETASN